MTETCKLLLATCSSTHSCSSGSILPLVIRTRWAPAVSWCNTFSTVSSRTQPMQGKAVSVARWYLPGIVSASLALTAWLVTWIRGCSRVTLLPEKVIKARAELTGN